MKKHILSVLTALLVGCIGIGALAACGKGNQDPVTYTLTYDLDGGTGTVPAATKYAEGTEVTIASGEGLAKGTSTFDGWLNGTTKVEAGSKFTMPAHDVTLKASWKAADASCTVSFTADANGTVSAASVSKKANEKVTLPTATPAKGYELDGWYKGTDKLTGTEYTVTEADVTAGTVTLTAKFTAKTYTVKFFAEKDAYTGTPVGTLSVKTGETIAEASGYSDITATKENYRLSKWVVAAGDVEITAQTTLSPDFADNNDVINVYATWTLDVTIGTEGTAGVAQGWGMFDDTNNPPTWSEKIKIGEKVTVSGHQKAAGLEGYQGVVAHLFLDNGPVHPAGACLRHQNAGASTASWVCTRYSGPDCDGDGKAAVLAMAADCDITIVWDWSIAKEDIVLTITYTKGTESMSAVYNYNGINLSATYSELNFGVGVDNAWVKLTSIERSTVATTELNEHVFGSEAHAPGYYPNMANVGTVQSGKKITVTGKLTSGDENPNGAVVGLFGDTYSGENAPAYAFRSDMCINAPNSQFPNQPSNVLGDWTVAITSSYGTAADWSALDGGGWAKLKAAKANCDFTLTVDWTTADQIVVKIEYAGTTTEWVQYTITGTLAQNYKVELGIDSAYMIVSSITIA